MIDRRHALGGVCVVCSPASHVVKDEIEAQYLLAIGKATNRGDNDRAQHLSTGLAEYRHHYKVLS